MSKPKSRRGNLGAIVRAAASAHPRAYEIEALEKRVLLSGYGAPVALASFGADWSVTSYSGVVPDSTGNLFGTTLYGGAYGGGNGDGTVFEVADGSSAMTTLASFNGTNGNNPSAGLLLDSSGNLYGTCPTGGIYGGTVGDGTVFEVARGSGAITAIASFNGNNGWSPAGGVVLDSSGNLFGTTEQGGASAYGTVFEIASGRGTITTLASFNVATGQYPGCGVVLDSSGNIFGATGYGGPYGKGVFGYGTVFEVAHGSSVVTRLAAFNGTDGGGPGAVAMDSSGDLFGITASTPPDGLAFEVAHGSGVVTVLATFSAANALPRP